MTNTFQFDDVTVSLIGPGAKAVLGYTDGTYANRDAMLAAYPDALHTFLTVHGTDFTADGVDSEAGDASTEAVVGFARVKHSQGKRPVIYTFLANMEALAQAVFASGIPREDCIFMCAHVTGVPHICGPQCGLGLSFTVDATQFTFTAENRSLDESWCTPAYFSRDLVPPKPPEPADPHHYKWLETDRRTIKGHKLYSERDLVTEYDHLRKHRILNHRKLADIQGDLLLLADRIATVVVAEAARTGKPRDWSTYRRGWRYQALVHRANGKRVVR